MKEYVQESRCINMDEPNCARIIQYRDDDTGETVTKNVDIGTFKACTIGAHYPECPNKTP
jgi:hypothetical protein